jgi:hypothetical protein
VKLFLLVHGSFEFCARSKFGNFLGGDLDWLSGLRITTGPGFSACDREGPEAYKRHATPLLQVAFNAGYQGIDASFSLGLVDTGIFGDSLDQVCFVHDSLLGELNLLASALFGVEGLYNGSRGSSRRFLCLISCCGSPCCGAPVAAIQHL